MASGVFVEQKLALAKNTLALCSRWSHREIQTTLKMKMYGNRENEKKERRKTGKKY